ncbi:SH2 domain-containing adapter protein F isoform X4 [Gallus gallus]|uniref:SH2 domain-containing adapter protein F isoform X4 n=1 Tax=Gallus gallus TaxID=9031 RepID=UPI001EFFF7EF|nr:SH2 domain-containing adapter protein F isoform X4 [Gallus gallus]
MELSFGSANAEICSCFLEPETHRQEWRDVACVLSRLQKKYECAEPCGVQSSERPSDLSQHKGVSRGAPTRLCPPHPAHRAAVELLWAHPLRRGSQHCSKLKAQLAVLEDYADPFDAAQVAGSQAGVEKVAENDGYMEPYEAQKMMAEIRQKGLREAPSRPLHLYDTPYEPVSGGLDVDTDCPACPRPRESRLPEDDERPPEEYDQPWEWKKERISKAFAVEIKVIKDLPWPPPVGQLNSGETPPDGEASASVPPQHGPQSYEDANGPSEGLGYGRTSPCREEKARTALRHGTSSLKSTKTLSVEPGPFLGERIDPALPLESQCWYHGAISRTDAETLLRLCKEASYLVRNSETSKNDFSLSLKSSQGFMHMKLSRTQENKYVLGQHSPPFDSVPEIIHHYASRKLPIKGAEHMSLLYPVAIRTL